MNLVALIGNVANEPELTYTPNGQSVCSFRLVVSRPGGEEADFFTIVATGRQAEVCDAYLHVGKRIAIEGCLHHDRRTDGTASTVQVIANRVQLLNATKKVEETV